MCSNVSSFFFVKMCYKCVSSKYVITSDKRFKITTFCTYYHRQSWRWWDIRWRWFSKCTSTAAYQQVRRLKTYLTHWPYTWTELSKLVTFFFFFFFVTCFFCSLSGLKAKSKTESLDPKKQKKLEKEEKDFRKKFKVCFHFSVSFSDSILIM